MNKRYMDFVPGKAAKTGRASKEVKKVKPRAVAGPVAGAVVTKATAKATPEKPTSKVASAKPAAKSAPARATVAKPVPRVAGEAKKSASRVATRVVPANTAPRAANEAKLGVVEDLGVSERSFAEEVEPAKKTLGIKGDRTKSETFKVPKTPFINQEKVVKRPLSKNVYQKKVVTPKEEPKGPVTIISKPEKDAHVSLIVAVILTIILGAAAGTIAFLLLPKQ